MGDARLAISDDALSRDAALVTEPSSAAASIASTRRRKSLGRKVRRMSCALLVCRCAVSDCDGSCCRGETGGRGGCDAVMGGAFPPPEPAVGVDRSSAASETYETSVTG